MEKIFEMTKTDYPKPQADISLATDYDQRYLGIINKIFEKNIEEWDERNTDRLNAHLEQGGQIAMYWHKGRIVGTVLWILDGDAWRITQMGFKRRHQGRGFGEELLDYMFWKIHSTPDAPKKIVADTTAFKI